MYYYLRLVKRAESYIDYTNTEIYRINHYRWLWPKTFKKLIEEGYLKEVNGIPLLTEKGKEQLKREEVLEVLAK